MSDDSITTEMARIDLDEKWEVRYWANRFNVTEDALRDAVKAVGTSVQAVGEYLDKTR